MISDPIADLIIRIKNAYMAKKKTVLLPYFKIGLEIIKILKAKNYIIDYKTVKKSKKGSFDKISITLKYDKKNPPLLGAKRISKPGLRIYVKKEKIGYVLGGAGIKIISTSKGIMTGSEAKKNKIGGEIICEIW